MSVTIQQSPQTMIPGFNDIIYVVSSDHVNDENFQFVCDLYLDDDAGNITHAGRTYLREKTPADPIHSSGVFNISEKIKQFLTYDVGNDLFASQKCPNSIISIQAKFGEEFGGSSGTTVYANQVTATTIRTFNGVLDQADLNAYAKGTFVGSTASTTRRFLTNQPKTVKARTTEHGWLYFLVESVNDANTIIVTTTDSVSADTQYAIPNDFASSLSTVGRYMIRVPARPATIMRDIGNWAMFDDIVKYTIHSQNDASAQDREKLTFNIDTTCTDHTIYTIHFLNRLGGFDTFSFIRAHTEETDVERKKFKRNLITRIGGGRYGYNNKDLSDVQYQTKHKDTIKLSSDWISEAEATWLEELITSPVVFHDDPTDGLLAINITDTKYKRKQWRTDGLFNLELSFQYSFDRYRQGL